MLLAQRLDDAGAGMASAAMRPRLLDLHYAEIQARLGLLVQHISRCIEQYGLHDVVLP